MVATGTREPSANEKSRAKRNSMDQGRGKVRCPYFPIAWIIHDPTDKQQFNQILSNF